MGILEGLGGSRYRLPTPDRDITTSELKARRGSKAARNSSIPTAKPTPKLSENRTSSVCADPVVGCERKPHRRACTGRHFLAEINRDRLDKYASRGERASVIEARKPFLTRWR